MVKGKFSLIIILIFLIGLYATNPSKHDFNEYATKYIEDEIRNYGITSNSYIDSLLGTITGKIVGSTTNIVFTREDYYLFSIYRIEGIDIDYEFIGVFKKFFPISI